MNAKYPSLPPSKNGFTLIELIVVLSIAGILTGMGVPVLYDLIQNNRLISQVNNFVASLQYARSEAVRRGERVSLCPSLDLLTCSTGGGEWGEGWIVFADGHTPGTLDGDDELLRVNPPLSHDSFLKQNSVYTQYISFKATGFSQGNGGNSGGFRLCDSRGVDKAYDILVNGAGRVRTRHPAISCS
ncbi:MAG: GspH/FimT family pseudopilin [Magnetococcus sp. DMHC-6]